MGRHNSQNPRGISWVMEFFSEAQSTALNFLDETQFDTFILWTELTLPRYVKMGLNLLNSKTLL